MSSDTETVHAHHWEVSWAPLVISLGITLLVPMTFASYFVYESMLMAIIFAGLGTPLLLLGISKWIYEGATQKMAIENVSDLGIGIFIVSEILIFLSLFVSYWTMRISVGAAGDPWPPAGTPDISLALPAIMTVILVASSATYHMGEMKYEEGDKAGFKTWLLVTIVLGLAFFACTAYEYSHLAQQGFLPGTNSFSSAFYGLTGFHAAHVLIGVLSFAIMLFAVIRGPISHMFVKGAGIYWHFVDVIWFFVASQVYLW
ncbi:MAG: heme-copper oxidase subunit III [Rhodospirillaceae bacterium]|jgi:cytochrome c oxidase subunit III|nr:heme-copper oxidase subunit III [Rhodospirillaceae bacterium]